MGKTEYEKAFLEISNGDIMVVFKNMAFSLSNELIPTVPISIILFLHNSIASKASFLFQ
jgi:hypothetical protein